ncbi:MAG TPA: long-chain fatty acid--CoA ligase [Hyphomonadaceae bacterium]
MVDRSRSRQAIASARHPDLEYSQVAAPLREPAARSLEHWARTRTSDAALFDRDAHLTYGDWNEYADMLADALTQRGLGHDDVIAVRCSNRIEWAVIAIAAAKIDAGLVTLDPELDVRALRERVILSNASAVIIGDCDPTGVAPALAGLPFRLRATIDVPAPGFFDFFDLFPATAPRRFSRARPALISWTQGETRRAMPIMLPRRIVAPVAGPRGHTGAGCSLLTVPLHRVWGPVQFWAALDEGRSVAFMRRFKPRLALHTIERRAVTHWSALPAVLHEIAALPACDVRKFDLSSMRELVVGGATVDWPLKLRLANLFGPIVSEVYGSTETGLISVMPPENPHYKPGSCGRPLDDVVVEIRDTEGRSLPANATGEIWARTPRSLACDLPGTYLYRDAKGFIATADLGRLDEDGFLFVTGRTAARMPLALRQAG